MFISIEFHNLFIDYNWITNSTLYNSLSSNKNENNDDDLIYVPLCKDNEDNINTIIEIIKYWDITSLSIPIIHNIRNNNTTNYTIPDCPPEEKEFYQFFLQLKKIPSKNLCAFGIKHNRYDIIQYCLHQNYSFYNSTANAAYYGNKNMLQYVYSISPLWNKKTSALAALNGHYDCLVFLFNNGCPFHKDTPIYAALHGHINCLEFAIQNGCQLNEKVLLSAIKNGHLECFEFIVHTYGKQNVNIDKCADICMKHNQLNCFQYLQKHYQFIITDVMFSRMAEYGRENFLKLYLTRNYPIRLYKRACYVAIKNGHFECFKFVFIMSCYGRASVTKLIRYAAKFGQLECLKLIHAKSPPIYCDVLPCYLAAKYGHLDCLQYLHILGSPLYAYNNKNIYTIPPRKMNQLCLVYIKQYLPQCNNST